MYALLIAVLAEFSRSLCLSSAALSGLGFTPIAPYTPDSTNLVCTDALGSTGQACVNLTSFYMTANAQKLTATQNDKLALASAAATYMADYNDLAALCAANFTSANVLAGAQITLATGYTAMTDNMVQQCNDLIAVNSTVITAVASVLTPDALTSCYNFVWKAMNGAACLLATTSASNYTTVTGTVVSLSASTNTSATGFAACVNPIFVTCAANSMATLIDATTNSTTASSSLRTACGNITALAACVASPSTCSTVVKQATVGALVGPAGASFGTAIPADIALGLDTLATAPNYRLLQAAAPVYTSKYTFSTLGYSPELASTGMSSNSTDTTFAVFPTNTTKTVSLPFVAPLVMSLLALLIN